MVPKLNLKYKTVFARYQNGYTGDELGISYDLIKVRYDKGFNVREILSTKPLLIERDKNNIKHNGTIEDELKLEE